MTEVVKWICPYCERAGSVVHGTNLATEIHYCPIVSSSGPLALISAFTVCPNKECQRTTVNVTLRAWDTLPKSSIPVLAETVRSWQLVPAPTARHFPDAVPLDIRNDYEEGCAIVGASPRAAAALARRALQGILRDFWGVSAVSLEDQISALQSRVGQDITSETWQRLSAVRAPNVKGAQPEAGRITDVSPGEADQLLRTVELLIAGTYLISPESVVAVAAI